MVSAAVRVAVVLVNCDAASIVVTDAATTDPANAKSIRLSWL